MGKRKSNNNYTWKVDRIVIGDVSSDKYLVRDEAIVSMDKKYIYLGLKGNWTLKLSDPIQVTMADNDDSGVTFCHLTNPGKVFSCHFDNPKKTRRMTARAQTQKEDNEQLLEEIVSIVSQRLHKKNNQKQKQYDEEQQPMMMGMGRVPSRQTFTPKSPGLRTTTSSSSTGRRTYSKKYGKKSTRSSLERILDRDFFQEDDNDTVVVEEETPSNEQYVKKRKVQTSKSIGKRLKKMVSNNHHDKDDAVLSDAESEDLNVKEETPYAHQFEEEEEEVDDDELSHPSLKSELSSEVSPTNHTNDKNDDVVPLSPKVTTDVVSTTKTNVTTVTDEEEGNVPTPTKADTTKKTTSIMSFFTGATKKNSNGTTTKTCTNPKKVNENQLSTTKKTPPATPLMENKKTNSKVSTNDTQNNKEASTTEQSSPKKKRLDLNILDSLQTCKPANSSQTTSTPVKTTASVTSKSASPSQQKNQVTPFRRVSLNRAAKNATHESPAKRDLKTYFSENSSIKTVAASPEKKIKITTAKESSPKNPYKKTEHKSSFAGLYNLGNTCYLNSSLQILFSTNGFLQELDEYKQNCNVGEESLLPLTTALLTIAKSAGVLPANDKNCRISNVVDPKKLKQAMDKVSDKFEGYEQRDAHEFLSDLLDSIHEELNQKQDDKETNEDSSSKLLPTDKYFHLNVKVCLTCDSCGYSRSKEEMYRHLSIDVADNTKKKDTQKWTIDKGLQKFFQPETLDIRCEKCKEGQSATQNMEIISFPKVLLLHLKRFIISEKYSENDKSSHSSTSQSNVTLSFRKNKEPVIFEQTLRLDQLCPSSKDYQLRGVVHHIGSSASSGHYTTDALRTDSNRKENWITFDDCTTKTTNLSQVLNNERSQENSYMIMYQQHEKAS